MGRGLNISGRLGGEEYYKGKISTPPPIDCSIKQTLAKIPPWGIFWKHEHAI